MWSRVGVHGGTSGRSDRLEQERQCVHNPSRNAHGRLYRQFLTVARILSLSLSRSLSLSPWVLHIRSSEYRSLREWVHVGRVDGDSELHV
jgi:hypothetical protein